MVKFWGVRGSIPCSDPGVSRYGGNTSSLEVRAGGRLILLDAGTGIRYLGNSLDNSNPIEADILLTHTHFDHVCGIPFFEPLYDAQNTFRVWAGHLGSGMTIQRVLMDMMMAPLFPVPLNMLSADMSFQDFIAGESFSIGPDVMVRTAPLNHPNSATAYRIDSAGKAFCYVTDTEHISGTLDEGIIGLVEGADYLVYDGMYSDDEYEAKVGWGHSTWQEGMRLSDAANVGTFILFHHDPDHDDDYMDSIAKQLDSERPGSIVAREGQVLEIS